MKNIDEDISDFFTITYIYYEKKVSHTHIHSVAQQFHQYHQNIQSHSHLNSLNIRKNHGI
jgi:hypothetical protein